MEQRILRILSKSRIPPELTNIIYSYVRHPYFDIAKRIRLTHVEDMLAGIIGDVNFIIVYKLTTKFNRFTVNRESSDFIWNIKYLIPKASFIKGTYHMRLEIGGEVCSKGWCCITEEGDNYVLRCAETSMPLPICMLAYHDIHVTIYLDGISHSSGILTIEHIYIDNRVGHSGTSTGMHNKLRSSKFITQQDMVFSSGMCIDVRRGAYKECKGIEVFPGVKVDGVDAGLSAGYYGITEPIPNIYY